MTNPKKLPAGEYAKKRQSQRIQRIVDKQATSFVEIGKTYPEFKTTRKSTT